MNSLILTCLLCAAPVPKPWKPPVVIDSWACGWHVTRTTGDNVEQWWFSISYTEAMMLEFIENEDRAKADPLNRKSP